MANVVAFECCLQADLSCVLVSEVKRIPVVASMVEAKRCEFNLACTNFFVCKDFFIFYFERNMIVHIFYMDGEGMAVAVQSPVWFGATSWNNVCFPLLFVSINSPVGFAVWVHFT